MVVQKISRQARKLTDPWRKQDYLLAFVHIPKTAGTSLVSAFKKEFRRSRVLRLDEPCEFERLDRATLRNNIDFLHGHFGMMDVENLATSHVTVLRDPVQRILSLYNYWRVKAEDMKLESPERDLPDAMRFAKELSFREFVFSDAQRIIHDIQNAQSYQIVTSNRSTGRSELAGVTDDELFGLACNSIKKFAAVGCVENMSAFEHDVKQNLGLDISVPVKNRTKKRTLTAEELPEDVLIRINEINAADTKLHKYLLDGQKRITASR